MRRRIAQAAAIAIMLLGCAVLSVSRAAGDPLPYDPFGSDVGAAQDPPPPPHQYGYANFVNRRAYRSLHAHEPGDTFAQVPCLHETNQCVSRAPDGLTRQQAEAVLANADGTNAGQETRPAVTTAMAQAAFNRLAVPAYRSIVQPVGGKTLVNFPTIFYTHAHRFTRTVKIAGQPVRLTAYPWRFTWHHGDGTDAVTTIPGAPYPRKDITYRYQHAHVTVRHSLTITWTGTWQLPGGPTQDLPAGVDRTGPSTRLHVSEAVPVLSGYGH